MARQTGIIPLSGSVGDMNFYQTKDGKYARKKGKIDPDDLFNGEMFANSRKAGKVFGLASTASRLIRTAFHEMILAGSNRDMHNRMLKTLQTNAQGAELLQHLPFHQLKDFNINKHALWATVCKAPYSVEMLAPGKITVSFPPFSPHKDLTPPPKARITHFRLAAGAAVIDCKKGTFKKEVQTTPEILHKQPLTEPVCLHLSIPVRQGQPWMVAIGIVFLQLTNNSLIESVNEHHLPVMITDVIYEPLPAPRPKKTRTKKKKRRS